MKPTVSSEFTRMLRAMRIGLLSICAGGLIPCCATAFAADVPTSASAPATTQSAAATQQVLIDNFTFSPEELTVTAGSSVTWINHDDIPHTATSTDKPRLFNSGALDTDQKFTFVFKTPGTYKYFCAVHPHMTGRIIVK